MVSKLEDFASLPGADSWTATWDSHVAACRAWYDANNWGKAFCCQGGEPDGEFGLPEEGTGVFNSGETISADTLELKDD